VKKKSTLEVLLVARAAEYYGVPKSFVTGYLLTKFLTQHDERDEEDEREQKRKAERQRVEDENWLNDLERKRGRTREFLEALEQYEETYGPRRKTGFDLLMAKPQVVVAVPQQQILSNVEPASEKRPKKWPLIVGILFLPYIFSWFTLRAGYSKTARILSFAWMIVVLNIVANDIARH
jgi:hypothetical protein